MSVLCVPTVTSTCVHVYMYVVLSIHTYICITMSAGEKLSKQELQSNSIIKKLRQKDKQNDQLLAAQRYTLLDLHVHV